MDEILDAVSEYCKNHSGTAKAVSEYEKSIEDMLKQCRAILVLKHREYATDDDFHNFNVSAKLQGITPMQALIGMMDKHVVSVHDLVNEHAEGRRIPLEKWEEKIGDNINYLLLLYALVREGDVNVDER